MSDTGQQDRRARWQSSAIATLLFFLLFTSYFMLRPVREMFGIAGGVDNLQWLFLATFVGSLVVVPLYGWAASRLPRRLLLPTTYGISAAVLLAFAVSLWLDPMNIWAGRAFYVWLSIFNLFAISLAWSLMADVFTPEEARALFGRIAAGASLGGLTGPLLSGLLVEGVGHAGLLAISTGLLLSTLVCARLLGRRLRPIEAAETDNRSAPIGGSIWAGLTTIVRSPILIAISAFVLLLTSVSTFLYFEQARIIDAAYPDPVDQTKVFSAIDFAVQSLTIFIQVFLTGIIARRLGIAVLLTVVPVIMIAGFGLLSLAASLPVLVAVMIVRRVGEYALVRPGREMLFSIVGPEMKYKSKNAIDTVVYRGGDAGAAWLNSAIVAAAGSGAAAIVGAFIAAIWAGLGLVIGKWYKRNVGGGPVPAAQTGKA